VSKVIGIYEEGGAGLLAHVVETIEEAASWLGVSRQALYKSFKLYQVMKARGYTLELINLEEAQS